MRGVSPVPREGVGNLLHLQQGAFALPFDLLASREIANIFENSDFIYMLNQQYLVTGTAGTRTLKGTGYRRAITDKMVQVNICLLNWMFYL